MTTPYEYALLTAIFAPATSSTAFTVQSAEGTRPLLDGGATHLQVLNLLGTEGWELVYRTAGPRGEAFATEYMLKRPLRQ
jgi:hypothetical protein